jgi:predicted secreted hydrolase
MNRPGLNTAGASQDHYSVVNENWSVEQLGDSFVLKANAPNIALHLILKSLKPPVVHGINGVSQKASCRGCASHYYSLTRLQSEGVLNLDGKPVPVTGLSWMDHEFGSNQLTKEQVGWDWFSLQLKDNTELMLYVMRKANGELDANSSGTLVRADGTVKHLFLADFKIKATGSWKSAKTGGTYPMGWTVEIPSEKLNLTVTPSFQDQELNTKKTTGVTYWEGASDIDGSKDHAKVTGQAYVEMTGYAERFGKNI